MESINTGVKNHLPRLINAKMKRENERYKTIQSWFYQKEELERRELP